MTTLDEAQDVTIAHRGDRCCACQEQQYQHR